MTNFQYLRACSKSQYFHHFSVFFPKTALFVAHLAQLNHAPHALFLKKNTKKILVNRDYEQTLKKYFAKYHFGN